MAKKKSSTSPTQRSVKQLRKQGYVVAVTERWNPFAKVRQDLFGVIDILILGNGQITGIQTTTSENMAARLTKIRETPNALTWLESGGRLLIHGWKKPAKSRTWECREIEVTIELLKAV